MQYKILFPIILETLMNFYVGIVRYYIECPIHESDRDQKVSEKHAEKLNFLSNIILVLFKLF